MNNYKAKIICKTNDIKYTDDYELSGITRVNLGSQLVDISMDNGVEMFIPNKTIISLHIDYISEPEVIE